MVSARSKPLHLAGYVRVSHVGGRGGDSFHSPDEQIAAIRAHCTARGHRLTVLPPELDASGGSQDRPILRHAVEAVEAGRFDGIVVAYGSRLARDVRIMLDVCGRVEAVGGRYIDVALDIDTSTPEGKAMRTIMAAHDQMVLDQHKERFETLRKASTEAGIWQRRQTPTGYDRNPSTRKLEPNGDAERVREAFRRRAAGESALTIGAFLGMSPAGARALLRNRVYLGELRVGAHVNPRAHEPIVTIELFDGAQRTQARPARVPGRPVALLAGIVRCATCGHVMSRNGDPRDDRTAYLCIRWHSGLRCPSPAGIVCARLHAFIDEVVLRDLFASLRVEAQAVHKPLKDLTTAAVDAEAELRAYVTATSAVAIGAEAFGAGLELRQARLDEAHDALRAERERHTLADVTEGGAEAWARLDPTARNLVLRSTLDAVAVAPVGRGKRVPVGRRVAVFPIGSDLDLPPRWNAGVGIGLWPLDLNHPGVLRV